MKKIVFLLIVHISIATYSQIKLQGTVTNLENEPLEMANIVAVNSQTKSVDSYGFTNSKGKYQLSLKKNTNYSLKVSYVGMKTASLTIITQQIDLKKNIVLENDNSLEEVNITYKMPVTIKGDTIVYNADSFTSGREKKLEDVLKKMPGISVNDDGKVEVEGKTVNKVMVEGKDFFDGDSKLATQNIPANAVDKVQVLKNFSEINQLKNVTDHKDNVALNIKLKEGKKNFWFGEVTAGIGINERYLAHPKLFYYNPKYSINIITDANNIGKIPFTWSDYFKFTGGFKKMSRGTTLQASSSDIGFLMMQNDKAKSIETQFGALNLSYSPKKTWDISGFAIYSATKSELQENNIKDYLSADITEKSEKNTLQNNNLGLLKLSSKFTPNTDHQLNYDAFIKISKQQEQQHLFSSELQNISEQKKQQTFSVHQNLNYYYTMNDKNIFSAEAQYLSQFNDPFYNAELKKWAFSEVLELDNSQSIYNINQQKNIKTNKLDAKIDHYYVINSKSSLNSSLGTTLNKQSFNSSIFQILDNKKTHNGLPSKTKNDVTYRISDVFAGLHYRFVTGIFTFHQGVHLHHYKSENQQKEHAIKTNHFIKLLPDASVNIQLKRSESVRFKYAMTTSFTDINNIAEGYVFNNYNQLFAGNTNLEHSVNHNFSLNYFNFNAFNFTNTFARVSYTKKANEIKRSVFLDGVNQIGTVINSAFADEILSASARFEKRFRKVKWSVRGTISHSKYNNLISFKDNKHKNTVSTSLSQMYRTRISTNFMEAPNFDIGYKIAISNYLQGNKKSKYITQSPFIGLDASLFNNFVLEADYTFHHYQNQFQTPNTYGFLNANLSYKQQNSSWEYRIEGSNLLNSKSLNRNSENRFYSTTSSYTIQPLQLIFVVKYNI